MDRLGAATTSTAKAAMTKATAATLARRFGNRVLNPAPSAATPDAAAVSSP